MFRIGIGNDTHRLVEGRPLIIGGVQVAAARGAEGHSDADVLAHAIADAILGAICEGDLGVHFPDRDEQWKDADSLQLLSRVMWLANERGLAHSQFGFDGDTRRAQSSDPTCCPFVRTSPPRSALSWVVSASKLKRAKDSML